MQALAGLQQGVALQQHLQTPACRRCRNREVHHLTSIDPCIVSILTRASRKKLTLVLTCLACSLQVLRPAATAAPARAEVESIPNATQFTNDIIADEKQ